MALTISLSGAQADSDVSLQQYLIDAQYKLQELQEYLVLLKASNQQDRQFLLNQRNTVYNAVKRQEDEVPPCRRFSMAATPNNVIYRRKYLCDELSLLEYDKAEIKEEIGVACRRIKLLRTIRSYKIK